MSTEIEAGLEQGRLPGVLPPSAGAEGELAEFASRHPWALRRDSFLALDRWQEGLGTHKYAIQPWPVLVDPAASAELARATLALSRLVREVPERVFDNDPGLIAEFYHLDSELTARLLIGEPTCRRGALGRGDFVSSPDGWMCLELNVNRPGMWQCVSLAPGYLASPALTRFAAESGRRLTWVDSIDRLLRHVAADALRPGLARLDLAVVVADEGEDSAIAHPIDVYRQTYSRVLAELAPGVEGEVVLARAGDLEAGDEGVFFAGRRIHAVVEQNEEPTRPSLFRAFKRGLVQLYNGPISWILGDKKNLAVISELADAGLLDRGDGELVARHLPWTRIVRPGATLFEGTEHDMAELLVRRRADLVLKLGTSYGGADVHFGAKASEERWRRLTDAALASGDWVVQRWVESKPFVFQAGEAGCCEYDLVWGAFVFGDTYGGAMVRMAPRARRAVINQRQGALIGLVFEVGAAPEATA